MTQRKKSLLRMSPVPAQVQMLLFLFYLKELFEMKHILLKFFWFPESFNHFLFIHLPFITFPLAKLKPSSATIPFL